MYSQAIINLDGTSSAVVNKPKIIENIVYVMRLLQLPFTFYENKNEGFQKLKFDMNRPDTLYILNDSLMYHLCEEACVLISRSSPWVVSTPKPNVIGQLTQEMIFTEVTLLMAIIMRNKPMRQHFDGKAASTYLLTNDFQPKTLERIAMFGSAAWSWHVLSKHDIHFKSVFHYDDGLPLVNNMLKDGMQLFNHPDDILIIANRDICFVKEATGILRAFMDSMEVDSCYGHRADTAFNGILDYSLISKLPVSTGIDFFAFRPDAKCIDKLLNVDLYLGRVGWDSLWAFEIKNKLPFNICYHYPHKSDWSHDQATKGENESNVMQVLKNSTLKVMAGESIHFETAK